MSEAAPTWVSELLSLPEGLKEPPSFSDGVLRMVSDVSAAQEQTSDAFGFKWHQRESFESEELLGRVAGWLAERYGNVCDAPWWSDYGDLPVVVDAGCGAGMSAVELFGERLRGVRYLGVDISTAVDVAVRRFADSPSATFPAPSCKLTSPGCR